MEAKNEKMGCHRNYKCGCWFNFFKHIHRLPCLSTNVKVTGAVTMNDKYIKLDDAILAMQKLYQEDVDSYGVEIPETFDAERAIEALKQLKTY